MTNRFRKVFIIVEEKFIFGKSNYMTIDIYRDRKDAHRICKMKQEQAIIDSQLMWNENKPIPQYKVHGFYLVHEELFKD